MKTFYRLNPSRVTFREYAFDNPWPVVIPVAGIIKLFRIPVSGSSDDPPVEDLSPFEVREEELPEEIRKRFAPLAGELAELGFGRPIFHQIYCQLQHTHIYWATFAHSSGTAAARIHHRVWSAPNIHKSYLFPVFISEMSDGTFLVSSAGRRDFITPKSVENYHDKGAEASELWREHQRRLDDRLPAHPVDVRRQESVRQMVERHHATLRDFHLARGVFRPVGERELAKLAAKADAKPAAAGVTVEDAVIARLNKQGTQQPSWQNFAVILVVSLLVFLAAGMKDMDKKFLWLLVPILLFHELGHYVAMRWFGYRNVRMFFIPFLGAAVAGKHYNIAGWKKALVALAGPVPGIVVGGALGIAGIVLKQPILTEAATLAMILNGLNLLPFLPLDGGWVVHAVLFCRHPLLDLAFRLVGILGLFGLSLLIGGNLMYLGVALLITLPAAWHVANVAHRLRSREAVSVSPDDVSIPEDAARTILAELGAGKHSRSSANVLSQQVTSVFETLTARPPGAAASVGLLAAHGGGFFLALVFLVVFMVFRHAALFPDRFTPREVPLAYRYTPGNTEQWAGKGATFMNGEAAAGKAPGTPPLNVVTLVASYPSEATAGAEFAAMPALAQGPGQEQRGAVCRFGQTVLVTLPGDDDGTRGRWKDRLVQSAKAVAVGDQTSSLTFRFSCTLPSEQEAEQLIQELDAYFYLNQFAQLLPPWSPARATLPPERQQSLFKARQTLGRLASVGRRAALDPELKAANDELAESVRSRDQGKILEINERLQQAMKAARERLEAEIADDQDEADQDVVELWQRLTEAPGDGQVADDDPGGAAAKKRYQVHLHKRNLLHREMNRCLGTLDVAGAPEATLNLNGCASRARFRQTGRTVSISSLEFRCPGVGLAAFGEWLAGHHASDIQYGYEAVQLRDWQDPDED